MYSNRRRLWAIASCSAKCSRWISCTAPPIERIAAARSAFFRSIVAIFEPALFPSSSRKCWKISSCTAVIASIATRTFATCSNNGFASVSVTRPLSTAADNSCLANCNDSLNDARFVSRSLSSPLMSSVSNTSLPGMFTSVAMGDSALYSAKRSAHCSLTSIDSL